MSQPEYLSLSLSSPGSVTNSDIMLPGPPPKPKKQKKLSGASSSYDQVGTRKIQSSLGTSQGLQIRKSEPFSPLLLLLLLFLLFIPIMLLGIRPQMEVESSTDKNRAGRGLNLPLLSSHLWNMCRSEKHNGTCSIFSALMGFYT